MIPDSRIVVSPLISRIIDQDKARKTPQLHESFWQKARNHGKLALRGFGLGLFTNLPLRRWLHRRTREPLKVVIRQSRAVAFTRSLIHIVPVTLALWLITLNWVTYYVGSFTLDQTYYQIGAKALEIMIQASLATITLAYTRHELVAGNGLPFGALFSGLQVSQISYLWSMELWGSVKSKSLPIRRKLFLLVLIVLVCILAAGAGPSAAVLLIPRRNFWPAGSTHIWIGGTEDDIWPVR